MIIDELKDADPSFLGEISQVVQGEHWDPHRILGLHPHLDEKKVIRVWRPGASEIYAELQGKRHPMRRIHAAGLFDLLAPKETSYKDYRVFHQNGLLAHDPYCFHPTWGDLDAHFFNRGVHYKLYEVLGARECEHDGVKGVKFAVWAPSARHVALIGDFNFWDGRVNPMRSLGRSGVWELFVPGLEEGERYKFEIKTQEGKVLLKTDPYAFSFEERPLNASVVSRVEAHSWNDQGWMEKRSREAGQSQPINIYEVHLGSWKFNHGKPLSYREVAPELASYCKAMGYTHIELMPVMEHPLDESWGYQVIGFYAVTSRFGTPEDFQWFVDYLHQQGIGVILDWVPGHFPKDDFALARFDGTCLYEHEDPRQGYHPHWTTLIFNYGRHEVSNFLLSSALFWIDKMHIDGLRVDAVASMLYLDYGREQGGWIPNPHGGRENLEAIEFLKHFNAVVHERFPGVLTFAEESTSFPKMTTPVDWDGLGFDFKWNMGWMHDTLRYFRQDPLYRRYHQNDLTFGLLYAFSEKFTLPFSHDEVVHGKASLLSKMPGDIWQKFANLRLMLSYMICQPGKKLTFMGCEIGQWNEWNCKEELHWHLLQYPTHYGLQTMVRELNHFYKKHPSLWEKDSDFGGFEWVDFSDCDQSVISYRRKSNEGAQLLCVHNFTPTYHPSYFLSLPSVQSLKELFCSDEEKYGGTGKTNPNVTFEKSPEGGTTGVTLSLAPLATHIFEIGF